MSNQHDHEEAREAYEHSVKRADDIDAVLRRTDEVVSMLRGERLTNHWAEKARAELTRRRTA